MPSRRLIRVDTRSRVAVVDGHRVPLSPTETALLRVLLSNPGRVITKDELFERVWGYHFGGNANVIQTYVSYLRRKLGPQFADALQTVRGVGYRFAPDR